MVYVSIFLAILLLTFLLIKGLSKVYKNPHSTHQSTPGNHNIPFEEIRFPTQNNCSLYGWWIPGQNNGSNSLPTLILVHGWGRNLERVLLYIRALYPHGFNMLAFDSRNHGNSDEDEYSTMVKFAEDIQAAVDFVENRNHSDNTDIGVIGLSIGGAAALYAASQDSRIRKVVTVGAFAHPGDIMRIELSKRHVPYFPLVWLLFKYIENKIGKKLDDIAPVNNIQKTQADILLIHGQDDQVVYPEHAQRLKQAGDPERVDLWLIPGKGHSNCHTHPEFWDRLISFFSNNTSG